MALLVRVGFLVLFLATADAFRPHQGHHALQTRPYSSAATSSTALPVTIYGHPGSRSPLVNWACFELGVDFTMGNLQQNPHPFGQLPCLTDDNDVVVFESGAILQYLHQKFAAMSPAAAAAVTAWIVWANASLDPICFLETPEGKVYDTGLRKPNKRINRLEEILQANQKNSGTMWLVPDAGFSCADVAVSSYLLYTLQFFPTVLHDMSQWPTVQSYMQACAERPNYAKAFGGDVQEFLVEKLQNAPGDKKKLFGMF
ncbi:glutathione S-transferase [Fistulifera solaris]|jgi:glutathione S-transferase/alpha,alpha-trehalase|uniref:Glutathione S-transferase n=1 Tax=Fistulifera solaris TaxID=1519565 RepID=A0A1Z5KCL6_FISSO|nr:glutathione S-transferase [Fistulifera solaris]|eukprot:GAX23895.1 glutathione S-transferase [Fistulifera solaris]